MTIDRNKANELITFRLVLLLMWLCYAVVLWPLPQTTIQYEMKSVSVKENRDFFIREIRKDPAYVTATDDTIMENHLHGIARTVWIRWLIRLTILFGGVATGIAAICNNRLWRAATLSMAFIYLTYFVLLYAFRTHASPTEMVSLYLFALKSIVLWTHGLWFVKFQHIQAEVLLPLFHIFSIALLHRSN